MTLGVPKSLNGYHLMSLLQMEPPLCSHLNKGIKKSNWTEKFEDSPEIEQYPGQEGETDLLHCNITGFKYHNCEMKSHERGTTITKRTYSSMIRMVNPASKKEIEWRSVEIRGLCLF